LVNSRILERRRLRAAPAHSPAVRRRRVRRDLVEAAGVRAADRLRASAHLRLYLGVVVLVAVLVAYVVLASQMTQTSYELARLQNQQAQLQAEQAQLRYQEANSHTPAQVQHDAQAAGLRQVQPTKYVGFQPVAIDLQAPTGAGPVDDQAPWQRAVAGLLAVVTGQRDVLAADR
jgi:cell division protein FtsL